MTITIKSTVCFACPSIWSLEPVILLVVDLGAIANDQVQTIAPRLTGLLPHLVDPTPSNTPLEPLPFPAEKGIATALGTLILNLQRLAGFEVAFSHDRQGPESETRELAVQIRDEAVGGAASELAIRVLNDVLTERGPNIDAVRTLVSRFGTLAAWRRGGPADRAIVAAARKRGIPVSRIDPSGRIIELGTGVFQRRIAGSTTSLTPKIGDAITGDKLLTIRYLRAAGLPVPDGAMARTVEQAAAIAGAIGYPVVVKPVDLGASDSVFVNLGAEEQVRRCFALAVAASPSGRVLVEQYIAGVDYRVMVVNDRVVSVSEYAPAHVIGNGESSVQRLIELANADPRRGPHETMPLKTIVVDEQTRRLLDRQQLTLESIPAFGQRVVLKPTGHIDHGGVATNRTGEVHPDNNAIFRQAVRVVGADIATIDVVAGDIAQSIRASNGAILEVNLGSGFRNELHPAHGRPRDPGPAVVDMLFPPGQPVRAQIIAVTGDADASDRIGRIIAQLLTASGVSVGLATSDEVTIDGIVLRGDGARTLLHNPSTEIIVATVDQEAMVTRGLGFFACDVVVITSLSGLSTPYGRPVETVLTGLLDPTGALVLDANDPDLLRLAQHANTPAVLFCLEPDNQAVREHLNHGGRAVVVRNTVDGDLVSLLSNGGVLDIAPVPERRLTPLEWLAAIAAAVAHDLPIETIRSVVERVR